MSVIHIEEHDYDELVSSGIVLVDFFAEWCGPCKMLSPTLDALSNQRDDVKIVKVNVDEQGDLARRFGIMSVPTLLLYKDGINVGQKSGFQTIDMLNSWIEESTK
ncbi:MAG TPA: thioredoxin [Mollicutes bacterium]|jgi:thioredoxin 1|nr:thioredoxin [Mollicutes bacterium]